MLRRVLVSRIGAPCRNYTLQAAEQHVKTNGYDAPCLTVGDVGDLVPGVRRTPLRCAGSQEATRDLKFPSRSARRICAPRIGFNLHRTRSETSVLISAVPHCVAKRCTHGDASAKTRESLSSDASLPSHGVDNAKKKKKKRPEGLAAWLWDQALHLWHGFRLLGANVSVTWRLKRQLKRGEKLTRRERLLLEKTTQDMLRLLPFSAFIIIPGGELLLPVALAMFPNLIPSTFDTSENRRRKQIIANLKAGISQRRLFEHMTLRILTEESFSAESSSLRVFRAMSIGDPVTEEEIRLFVPYFENDAPLGLSKLPLYVLRDLNVAMGTLSLARSRIEMLMLPRSWCTVRMQYAIDRELERWEEDDRCLAQVDLASLTPQELEHECVRRRLRWFGPPDALRSQLRQWVSLSLDPDVPNHMLLFLVPRATEAGAWYKFLSKSEREHILGLERFRDTPQIQFLRTVSQKSAQLVRTEKQLEKTIMEEDLDELKRHVEEVKQENVQTRDEFGDMREDLRNTTDDELLTLFDELLVKRGPKANADGVEGVEVVKLGLGLVELLRKRNKGKSMCKPTRIFLSLRGFDIDETGVISRDEFRAFLSRMRSARSKAGRMSS